MVLTCSWLKKLCHSIPIALSIAIIVNERMKLRLGQGRAGTRKFGIAVSDIVRSGFLTRSKHSLVEFGMALRYEHGLFLSFFNHQHAWRGQREYPIHKHHHRRGPSTLPHSPPRRCCRPLLPVFSPHTKANGLSSPTVPGASSIPPSLTLIPLRNAPQINRPSERQ